MAYPGYNYRPNAPAPPQSNEWWADDHHSPVATINNPSVTVSADLSASTMHRYLEEPDRHVFAPSTIDWDPAMHPFPNIKIDYATQQPWVVAQNMHQLRFPSPSDSGPTSTYVSSSGWSDRRSSTSYSSPDPSGTTCSPELAYADQMHGYRGGLLALYDPASERPCVAMHQIQHYADAEPDHLAAAAFDDDTAALHGAYLAAQEGYEPMMGSQEHQAFATDLSPTTVSRHVDSPNLRRRRAQSKGSITATPRTITRVTKRPSPTTTTKRSPSSLQVKWASAANANASRAFTCPFATYGCPSTFGSKNEWKRHINTQHMKLGFWRCDECSSGSSDRRPNDFNRKDLFIQHVRRMHPTVDSQRRPKSSSSSSSKAAKSSPARRDAATDDALLAATAERCFVRVRAPPAQSSCLFCEAVFSGASTWDERLEHVGRHIETQRKENVDPLDPRLWRRDGVLEAWLVREGLVVNDGEGDGGAWVVPEA